MVKIAVINDTSVTAGADNTSDLGSSSIEWKDLYIDGTAYIDSIGESILFADNITFTIGTGTGLTFGITTNSKLGFLGATPVARQSSTTDLRTLLINFGFLTSGGASPLNLNGGLLTAGTATITTLITVATASITGNLIVGGVASVTGNIIGGATITVGTVSATGNAIVGGLSSIAGALIVTGSSTLGGLTFTDNRNITVGTGTGTTIATGTNQKIGFYNATAIVQPSTTGETAGFTAGAGTNVTDQSTFTGNVGTTAYRISDIVKALKELGLILS